MAKKTASQVCVKRIRHNFGKCPRSIDKDAVINYATVHLESKQKGITLRRTWEILVLNLKTSISYAHFCKQYRDYRKSLKPA